METIKDENLTIGIILEALLEEYKIEKNCSNLDDTNDTD